MAFEPQKLFIGLIEFFSILMPGAMLGYLTKDWAAGKLGLTEGFPLDSTEAGLVFLFACYLLGHGVFLLSAMLDDLLYDPFRALTDCGQIDRRLAQGKPLAAPWKRRIAASKIWFGGNADAAIMLAQRIKARVLGKIEAESAVNTFQWCKARLAREFAEGLLIVQRFEAASKFFRSFVVVLGLLALFNILGPYSPNSALICLVGMLPALWRYIEQRFKATQQAYWHVLTLEALNPTPPYAVEQKDGLTHAGAVVYRGKEGSRQFLLVEASRNRDKWVLPKGHIESGENPRATAVREVREETGHWARITGWLEDSSLGNAPNAPKVRWFVMELAEVAKYWPEENRRSEWLFLSEAKLRATFPESRHLLERAADYLAGS